MSWTYSGDPQKSTKDAVRFLVGDTNSDEQLATDEEILFALSTGGDNMWVAASFIADALATKFATMADSEEIGPIKVQYTNRVQQYTLKAKALAAKTYQFAQINVYGGGIDIQDKVTQAQDETLTGSNIRIGMNDFVGQLTESVKQ
jgi:hypothetical protein